MKYVKYFSAYVIPGVVALSLFLKGWWSFFAIAFIYILIPLVELLFTGSQKNMSKAEEEVSAQDSVYDYILYGLIPVQFLLVAYFLFEIGNPTLEIHEIIGMIASMGTSLGVSINIAHELGHRKNKFEKLLCKITLMGTLYMHFYIEHNRGHHNRVATEEDPASSRYGENLYFFYIRTVYNSYFSAWDLERQRLSKSNKNFWSWENEMIRFHVIQFIYVLAIFLTFGLIITIYFLCAAMVGILLLETVNYVEHYGLQRKKVGKRYERTMPIHSWNSNHPLGRMILLELSRHSDHHYQANRKYQVLRHFDDSPQMPTGYPGMILLALFPPLWFMVMNKRVKQYKDTLEGDALA